MAHTVKRENTKHYLDELAKQRRTRQLRRELKSAALNEMIEPFDDLEDKY